MAAMGMALWGYAMKYNPKNPDWFNRDRFVLSNGHCCLFQYMFLHLTGYNDMTVDQLKSYHSVLPDSLCPGHPEVEIHGIEVTTGPLGQGISNAVGLAMATEHLAALYNKPHFPVVDNMTYCTVGDACLQEGVALEAISLAGHWRLKSLVVLYDNNQITCDGSVDVANTEDVNAKMRACNWDVIDIADGCYDITGIVSALEWAKHKTTARPTFINCKTIIGIGSQKQGQASTHGAAFGVDDVKHIKQTFGMNPDEHFIVPPSMRDFFAPIPERGARLEAAYNDLLAGYARAHPDLAAEFAARRAGQLTQPYAPLLPAPADLPTAPTPGRKSAGAIATALASRIPNFLIGTADLTPSVNLSHPALTPFQHPDLKTTCGLRGTYAGRYIHYGIREHAMAAIASGLSAYRAGTILPVTSSFFMFYIYAAPGLRMAALQRFHQIHIATHDSIGTGEDGPTHQPVELAALYRAMPNFLYIRPCDGEEAAGAWSLALAHPHGPSLISVSRQPNPQYPAHSRRDGVQRGGYVFRDAPDAAATLVSAGAEMKFAVAAADALAARGLPTRIVSMPCQRAFDAQPAAYRRAVFGDFATVRVAVEAYSMHGWERYADAGFGMSTFGHSLPGAVAYAHFGFDGANIAEKVEALVREVRDVGLAEVRCEFRELNTENYEKGLPGAKVARSEV